MMEKELLQAFEAAKKAADAAAADGSSPGGPEEARCIDALKRLRDFPVTMQVLVSTQIGKSLRALTKHHRAGIQVTASELLDKWKKIVIEETSKTQKKNSSSDGKQSTKVEVKSDPAKIKKISRSKSEKFDQGKTRKVEFSRSQSCKVEKVDDVETMKTEASRSDSAEVEKNADGIKEPSMPPSAPPKLTSMIKCNDPVRDKFRLLLAETLSKVSSETTDEDMKEEVNACDPIRVAVSVESVMFAKLGNFNGAQKVKYRSIMFNLKDANNPDLRRRVLVGTIKPERLINMSPVEMASDKRKQENDHIKEKALFECELGGAPKATTDQFKCARCGQRQTTYYQMQTRSADEPMTTFVTCVNCNNHWKFC